ncbi:MAG: lytic transglycosylase [Deltaproteobacteria bacterium]|nr:MAG: lytic transglycosylase [Deltaproteobacteria bacterium]
MPAEGNQVVKAPPRMEEKVSEATSATESPHRNTLKKSQQLLDEALEFCTASQDFWAHGDFENAIASLDQAYSLILQADTNDDPKLIQQKEDIRFMISKRMLEIYASQHTVVNGNHDAIPMVMNRHVRREINLFKGAERNFFIRAYKRSGRYRMRILKALKEAGLPEELSWLPLIESGFNVKALSRARALGLWQFIPSTGYKFGLKRDQWIDERMDVDKSTQAAIAYLRELHNIFGDWCTVLAAYNCGEGKVLRVIRNQNINYLDNFWDLFEKLPWETARYVPRFLAALFIVNNPKQFGLDLTDPDPPCEWEVVTTSKQLHLADIAKVLGMSEKSLVMLNPELRYKITPPTSYELKIPEGKRSLLIAKMDKLPAYIPSSRLYSYHRVRPGETLSQLARRYHTSVRAISNMNNIRRENFIRAGRRLKIPTGRRWPVYVATSKASSLQSKSIEYHVRRGDSLWLLARRYKTNIQQIMRLNGMKSTRLHIGQKLIIPKGTHQPPPRGSTAKYRVKRGDSPYQIAMRHNMKLERFLRLNKLTPRSKIYPGQVFLVDVE